MLMETPVPPPLPVEQPERRNNAAAVAAGACGIGSIVAQLLSLGLASVDPSITSICSAAGGIAWIAGIVLGIVGLVQICRHPDQKGKAWAIIGIVLGILRICIGVIMILLLVPIGPVIGQVSTQISSTLIAP
jgi:ABC-type antimicrobial peptide transport system permease subunit